jgi:hypothetical protein
MTQHEARQKGNKDCRALGKANENWRRLHDKKLNNISVRGTIDHCGRGARAKKVHPLYIHSFIHWYTYWNTEVVHPPRTFIK